MRRPVQYSPVISIKMGESLVLLAIGSKSELFSWSLWPCNHIVSNTWTAIIRDTSHIVLWLEPWQILTFSHCSTFLLISHPFSLRTGISVSHRVGKLVDRLKEKLSSKRPVLVCLLLWLTHLKTSTREKNLLSNCNKGSIIDYAPKEKK